MLTTSKSIWSFILSGVLVSSLSVSCATTPSGPPPALSVGATLPHLERVGETTATQKRGEVVITLAPVGFDTATSTACSYEKADPGILTVTPEDVSERTHTYLEEERFEVLSVQPSQLEFLLTIRNQMQRVFRGNGAVVQFMADQEVQAVEQAKYMELLNALIPPGSETQIRIEGPSLSALQDSSTLSVQLFDVVTAIDSAGNVANRDNYEWNFRVYKENIRRVLDTIESRRRAWVPNAQARSILSSVRNDPSMLPTRLVAPDGTPLRSVTVRNCHQGGT